MKLHIFSDTHFENQTDEQVDAWFAKRENLEPANLCVLAGDITCFSSKHAIRAIGHLQRFAEIYKDIVYVFGNHESYYTSIDSAVSRFKEADFTNIYLLENSSINVQGQHFYGGTLWFEKQADYLEHKFSDYRFVKDLDPRAYHLSRQFKTGLSQATSDSIVVSHHLPFPCSVDPNFKHSEYNVFFLNDCTNNMVEYPKLWVHGHTHSHVNASERTTKVFANPYGYKAEQVKNEPLFLGFGCFRS